MQIKYSKVGRRNLSIKPQEVKQILFILFIVGSFYLNLSDIMNVSLMIITFWRYSQNRFLKSVDKFDLTMCICAIIARQLLPNLQSVILSLCFFSFKFNLNTLLSTASILKRIKNLATTMLFLYILTAYLFTYMYQDHQKTKYLFGNFGNTCLTLLEILTLDSWGSRGRALEAEEGLTGIPSILIVLYVFSLSYFYMNILIGLILESLQIPPKITKLQQENALESWMLGANYERVVFICSFSTVCFNLYHNFQGLDWEIEYYLNQFDNFLYTVHFIGLLLLKDSRYKYERNRPERMLLHFIAGPLSFMFDHNLSCVCNLLKLATTPMIKGVFSGTIAIIPIIFPNILLLVSTVLVISTFSTKFYSQYIGPNGERYYASFWETFYTYVQILTLDDWCANILPSFKGETIIPHIVFPIFIFMSNFIFLNILIAFSCKFFKEIDYGYSSIQLPYFYKQNPIRLINNLTELNLPKIQLNQPQTNDEKEIKQNGQLVKIVYKGRRLNALIV